jgi:hypothetical protein
MGFNVSYMASRYTMAELADIYDIELGPDRTEIPDNGRPWIAALSNGWTIWWLNEPDGFYLHMINPHLACPKGEASYAVSVSEFCMHSSFAKFTGISKRWSVTHHGDGDDAEHLATTGTPPKIFRKLRDDVLAEQRNQPVPQPDPTPVPDELKAIADRLGATISPAGSRKVDHVFDLPVQLGGHFFGFRYDRMPEQGTILSCREVLGPRRQAARRPSLWQRLLGR